MRTLANLIAAWARGRRIRNRKRIIAELRGICPAQIAQMPDDNLEQFIYGNVLTKEGYERKQQTHIPV